MRTSLLPWAGALALLAGAADALALTPAEVFAKVAPSVWRLRTYDDEGLPLGLGSAVVIGPETLVTSCHVLRKAARLAVAREGSVLGGKLEMWDPDPLRDLCQIRVPKLKAPAVAVADGATLAVGQNVYALGNPEGLELTFSAGLVSSLKHDEAGRLALIQTSAPISPGSSGGGLFDDRGRLVGLTAMLISAPHAQNLNFAIPADWIGELAQRFAARAKPALPAGAVRPPAASMAAAVPAVPFLKSEGQARYRRFLSSPLPRAFAIADNGSYAWASGSQPANPTLPADPRERALKLCAQFAGKSCTLYAVDDKVVYQP